MKRSRVVSGSEAIIGPGLVEVAPRHDGILPASPIANSTSYGGVGAQTGVSIPAPDDPGISAIGVKGTSPNEGAIICGVVLAASTDRRKRPARLVACPTADR